MQTSFGVKENGRGGELAEAAQLDPVAEKEKF